jgi:saccharopine dehydrogenase-like NADP-dependent oxidoreductase
MQELDVCVKENNLVFMNEIGLDPGIDHHECDEGYRRN